MPKRNLLRQSLSRTTHKKLSKKSQRESKARSRGLRVLALMRRRGLSLSAASRVERTKPGTVLRYFSDSLQQQRTSGRFQITKTDRHERQLQIPSADGIAHVSVRSSKTARLLSRYANAVNHFLRTGDESQLKRFKGKSVRSHGRKIELITDSQTLLTLAHADALKLDQLYAPVVGGR